jgi:hypothetical protein
VESSHLRRRCAPPAPSFDPARRVNAPSSPMSPAQIHHYCASGEHLPRRPPLPPLQCPTGWASAPHHGFDSCAPAPIATALPPACEPGWTRARERKWRWKDRTEAGAPNPEGDSHSIPANRRCAKPRCRARPRPRGPRWGTLRSDRLWITFTSPPPLRWNASA